jgi:hypothetical protein
MARDNGGAAVRGYYLVAGAPANQHKFASRADQSLRMQGGPGSPAAVRYHMENADVTLVASAF